MKDFTSEKVVRHFEENVQVISVIVPVYNVASYLERCIKSLIRQEYPNVEIILVNDGSTDGSGIICDNLQKKYPQLVVIHQNNKGVSSARNTGLKKASGAYIGFVDPDDYVDENMYSDLHDIMLNNNADVVACTWVNEYENGLPNKIQMGIDAVFDKNDAIAYDLLHKMYITCNKLFSRRSCENLFYDEEIINGEDRLFDISALLKADRIAYVNKPYYHYCHRKNSAGTKEYTHKDLALIKACEKIKQLLKGKSRCLEQSSDAHLQRAYVQLLRMMKYDIRRHPADGLLCIKKIRKAIVSVILNPYNSYKFKIKVILICLSINTLKRIYEWKKT